MNTRKTLGLLCLALTLLLLTGCGIRARIIEAPQSETNAAASRENVAEAPPASSEGGIEGSAASEEAASGQPSQEAEESEPDPNAPTRNDPEAGRREYASDASAQLTEGAQESLAIPGDGERDEMPEAADESASGAFQADSAALTVTETLNQAEAERLGVSEEAPVADSVLQYYQAMLTSRLESLFECERLYVYWETPEDYRTVFKTSVEHQIILLAGGYDVAAKRMEDALTVDDGWIGRKNPDCVVKCVNAQVLGGGVHSTVAAEAIRSGLLGRSGWSGLDAVRAQKVVLVSEELLDSPAGQVAAALYIARAMYPELFSDVEPADALRALLLESAGIEANGVYAYVSMNLRDTNIAGCAQTSASDYRRRAGAHQNAAGGSR